MPHIAIKLYPGRSEEVKQNLAEKVRDFLMAEMDMEEKYFSVSVEEVEKEKWQEEVVDRTKPEELFVQANF